MANSHWVMDDFSTSSSEEHYETVLPHPTNASYKYTTGYWEFSGHDCVIPESTIFESTGNNAVSGVSESNTVSGSNTVTGNNTVSGSNTVSGVSAVSGTNNFNNWETDDDMPPLETPSPNVNRGLTWNELSFNDCYVDDSNDRTYKRSLSPSPPPLLPIEENCIIENEPNIFIELKIESPRPPHPQRSPPSFKDCTNQSFVKTTTFQTNYQNITKKNYIDIESVFEFVTHGKKFADEHYQTINEHVCKTVYGCKVDNIQTHNKFLKEVYSVNGRKYQKTIVMYDFGQYYMVAFALLEWVVSNPEKVA